MLQNIQINPYEAIILSDGRIIFLNAQDQRLYEVDEETGVIEDFGILHREVSTREPTGCLLEYGDYIIGVPNMDNRIAAYNISRKETHYFDIREKGIHFGNGLFNFSGGVVFGEKIFLFGNAYPGIISYEFKNDIYRVINTWIDLDRDYSALDGCFHQKYIRKGNTLFIPFMNTNAVMEFDLESEEYVIHDVGDKLQRYISIESNGDFFYLVPRDGRNGAIVKWDYRSGEICQYSDYPMGFNHHQYAFYRSYAANNKLIMFAHRGNMNVCFDMETEKMSVFDDLYDSRNVIAKKYSCFVRDESRIVFLTRESLVKMNENLTEHEIIEYKYGDSIINRLKRIEEDRMIMEKYEIIFHKRKKDILGETPEENLSSFSRYVGLRK